MRLVLQKHSDEVKALNKKHDEELQRIKEERQKDQAEWDAKERRLQTVFRQTVDVRNLENKTIKDKHAENLKARDEKYADDITKLKKLHATEKQKLEENYN